MDEPARQAALEAAKGAQAAMFLGTAVAWRIVDVLVAKGVIDRPEARAALFAIADSVRRDAEGLPSVDMTERIARTLEDAGMRFGPPRSGTVV